MSNVQRLKVNVIGSKVTLKGSKLMLSKGSKLFTLLREDRTSC
jgi:hypothetical protein